MQHIDQHTLGLYSLNSAVVADRRSEIEAHCTVCFGCRQYVEQMKSVYGEAENLLAAEPVAKSLPSAAIAKTTSSLSLFEDFSGPLAERHNPSRMQRFSGIIRRYPIRVSVGFLSIAAGLAMMVNFAIKTPEKDTNIAKYAFNPTANTLEVYNSRDEKLFQFLIQDAAGEVALERSETYRKFLIQDLQGTGQNNIYTTVMFPEDVVEKRGSLRIINNQRKVVTKMEFTFPFNYLNRPSYSPFFQPAAMVIDSTHGPQKSIIVVANNIPRSPALLVRLNPDGTVVDTYWHFGCFGGVYTLDLFKDGKQELIVIGKDDSGDTTNLPGFPFIAVLDPSKIVGSKKSTSSPGFTWDYSDAELYYVKLPSNDMIDACQEDNKMLNMVNNGNDQIYFHVGNDSVVFSFFFTIRMEPIAVKSEDRTNISRIRLLNEGMVTGKIDDVYLENLKNEIRYWDGREWRKEPVRVNHEIIAGK